MLNILQYDLRTDPWQTEPVTAETCGHETRKHRFHIVVADRTPLDCLHAYLSHINSTPFLDAPPGFLFMEHVLVTRCPLSVPDAPTSVPDAPPAKNIQAITAYVDGIFRNRKFALSLAFTLVERSQDWSSVPMPQPDGTFRRVAFGFPPRADFAALFGAATFRVQE